MFKTRTTLIYLKKKICLREEDMSHFSYSCKMRCSLNLVLEKWEYLWFY